MHYILHPKTAAFVSAHPSNKAATTALNELEEGEGTIVSGAEELGGLFSGPKLVELHNSLGEAQVTKFKSKDIGAEATWAALELAHNEKVKKAADKAKAQADKAAAKSAKEASKSEPEGEPKPKRERKPRVEGEEKVWPRPGTKKAALVELLNKSGKKGVTVEEITAATGFDANNARTIINFLKNGRGDRTPMAISYDRESQRYTLGA